MTAQQATAYQQAIANRNIEAILDAATELLPQGAQVTISAVPKQAGLSQVTVHAHLPTWEPLLAAAAERAVRCSNAAKPTARSAPTCQLAGHRGRRAHPRLRR